MSVGKVKKLTTAISTLPPGLLKSPGASDNIPLQVLTKVREEEEIRSSFSLFKKEAIFTQLGDNPDGFKDLENSIPIIEKDLLARVINTAIEEQFPFASVREGNRLNICLPPPVNAGEILGEILTLLSTKLPSVSVMITAEKWVEPTWSALASKHLIGIVTALTGPPVSFNTSSNTIELTSMALWHEACANYTSTPGGVANAKSIVIPSLLTGSESANKYMSKCFATLRTVSSDPKIIGAIESLARLLKLWVKEQSEACSHLIRSQKIAWSAVLHKGAPEVEKKVKGKTVKNIVYPLKPSKSPWCWPQEAKKLSSFYTELWSAPDSMRKQWIDLTANEQHDEFQNFVSKLKKYFSEMQKTSSRVLAELGHRKRVITNFCTEHGVKINKKDASDPWKWSQAFWKLPIVDMNVCDKLVFFTPNLAYEAKEVEEMLRDIVSSQWPKSMYDAQDIANDDIKACVISWLGLFKPQLEIWYTNLVAAATKKGKITSTQTDSEGQSEDEGV